MIAIDNDRGWRVMIERGNFMRDELALVIALKTPDGYKPATITITIGEPIPYNPGTNADLPESALPTELAEVLLTALAGYLLGTDRDMVATIHRLERELGWAKKQLESLIAGIGRMGGVKQ